MQITKITCLERNPPVQLELCFETASTHTPPIPASQPFQLTLDLYSAPPAGFPEQHLEPSMVGIVGIHDDSAQIVEMEAALFAGETDITVPWVSETVVVSRGTFRMENGNGNRFKPRVFPNNPKNAIRQRGVVSSHFQKNWRTAFSLPPIRFYEARPPPFCSCAV